jgi:hypothetical protein
VIPRLTSFGTQTSAPLSSDGLSLRVQIVEFATCFSIVLDLLDGVLGCEVLIEV